MKAIWIGKEIEDYLEDLRSICRLSMQVNFRVSPTPRTAPTRHTGIGEFASLNIK